MDEPIEDPSPPSGLPEEVVEKVATLSTTQLRELIEFAESRLKYREAPLSERIEPREGEEIVRMKDYGHYAVVVKRNKEETDRGAPSEPPHVYVVTVEPEPEGGHHLHWEDIGRVNE